MSESPLLLEDAEPLYRQIYRDIERKINAGEIGFMQQIPTLPELCRQYGVSEAPVRRALDELSRDGYVVKRRGRGQGTFAIKRLTPLTVRVLLVGDFDLGSIAVEAVHEVFDLIAGIRDAARERGCVVQQASVRGFDSLPPAGPDVGYLVIALNWDGYREAVRLLERHDAPFVLVNAPLPGFPCVRVDMEHGAHVATRHLTGLGHRRVAYVGSTVGPWFAPRFEGYRRALADAGIEFAPELVRETDGIRAEQDHEALDALLALPSPPTAVFACSDYRALHLLSRCRERGVDVPGRLSIVGYDDISDAANVLPPLTTVRHPRYEQGRVAVDLISEGMIRRQEEEQAPATPADRPLLPELIVRGSAAPPDNG